MTIKRSLPTYADAVQAEALVFASEMIARYAHGTNPWSEHPAMSPDASHAVFRHILQLALQYTPTRMDIIARAKAGDLDAIEMLRALLLECKAKRLDMPSDLIEYDMHVTRQGQPHHSRPGRKKKSYLLRDLCINMTVAAVVDRYMLDPTGRSPRHKSACAIVAEALGMDYDAVRKIWQHYGRNVAGWANS
jgi:hypothetical protein